MKQTEKDKLIEAVRKKVQKNGIPINVRTGGNTEAAEWAVKVLEKCIEIDEPLGVIQGYDYDHCPKCNSTIGQSAYYCKRCGSYLRYSKDWG